MISDENQTAIENQANSAQVSVSRKLSQQTIDALAQVSIIVVTFNSAHCIAALANSFADSFATTLAPCPQLIFVDNASADNTIERIKSTLPAAQIIALERNLGFGAANNLGVKSASSEFVLLLNPDCVITHEAIAALVATAKHFPLASTIAPQLTDRHGKPDISYRWLRGGWSSKGKAVSKALTHQAEGVLSVGFVSGACMLIRRQAFLKVNGFDERFFLYYEDEDLCIRLQRDAGELLVEPASQVQHLSRASSAGKARLHAEYLRGYHHIQSKFLFQQLHLRKLPSALDKTRYAALAGLEAGLRLLAFDRARAMRAWGRVRASWRIKVKRSCSDFYSRLVASSVSTEPSATIRLHQYCRQRC